MPKRPRDEMIVYYRAGKTMRVSVDNWANGLLALIEKRDRLKEELERINGLLSDDVNAGTQVVKTLAPPAKLADTPPEEEMRRVYIQQLPEYLGMAVQGRKERLVKLFAALDLLD